MRNPTILCLFLCCAAGCGGGSSNGGSGNPIQQNADISGAWQAVATSNSQGNPQVLVEANVTEANGAVSANASAFIGTCAGSGVGGTIVGTVSGNSISLNSSFEGETTVLSGTVSGSSMSGTYTATGVCLDSGTWNATKMPLLAGNYAGNLFSNSNPAQPIPVTASLSTSASFVITGSASVSSVCFNQFTLTGTQIGGAGAITATDPQGDTVGFLFASKDSSFGTIAGAYEVTAGPSSCNGDAGTGTLVKQ
jgi:hypothetical protein